MISPPIDIPLIRQPTSRVKSLIAQHTYVETHYFTYDSSTKFKDFKRKHKIFSGHYIMLKTSQKMLHLNERTAFKAK